MHVARKGGSDAAKATSSLERGQGIRWHRGRFDNCPGSLYVPEPRFGRMRERAQSPVMPQIS